MEWRRDAPPAARRARALEIGPGEAHFDLARAERQSQAIALAQTLLQTAPSDWEHAATLGESQGMSWTRQCALWPFVRSPRLALLDCRVTIQRNNETPIALETAFAIPREALLRP